MEVGSHKTISDSCIERQASRYMSGLLLCVWWTVGSCIWPGNLIAGPVDPPRQFIVQALPGDGVYSMLRRYELDGHSCNFSQFYQLNRLKRNANLIVGRSYQLPIRIYAFNGVNIRTSIGISDFDTALNIQHYNERMLERQLRTASFKQDKQLWVPHHALNCPRSDRAVTQTDQQEPAANTVMLSSGEDIASGKNRIFPIFGKDYEKVPLVSNRLRGQVYYVVAGHGGPDPGAIGRRGNYQLCEDEYAYDVALRLARHLISHGATAYMINRDANDGIRNEKFLPCDSDEVLWGNKIMSRSHKARLTLRSDIINDLYKKHRLQGVVDQRLISIHVDSRNRGERTDVFFYHRLNDTHSKRLANNVHQVFRQKYKRYQASRKYHGTVSGRGLHMLRETQATAVYVELANIRNVHDQQRIILARNRQYLADWLFEGVVKPVK